LAAVGLPEDLLDGSDAKEIRKRFDEIGKQLTEIKQQLAGLETRIEQTNYNTLVASVRTYVTATDERYQELVRLFKETRAPDFERDRKELVANIEKDIEPVPRNLKDAVGGSSDPLADNILTAGSKLAKSRAGRFFGPRDAAKVRAVYDK